MRTVPGKIRKLALELIETTANFTELDRQIVALNEKRVPLGLEMLVPSEHLMRRLPGTPDQTVEEEVELQEPADGSGVGATVAR